MMDAPHIMVPWFVFGLAKSQSLRRCGLLEPLIQARWFIISANHKKRYFRAAARRSHLLYRGGTTCAHFGLCKLSKQVNNRRLELPCMSSL